MNLKDREGHGSGLIEALSLRLPGGNKKKAKNLIVSFASIFRTEEQNG
jgi:hypothetical protein